MAVESSDIPGVLIVDDDKDIRGFVTVGLTAAGYRTSAVGSVEEAASALAKDLFDLVLLDIHMPVRSGIEYLPELLGRAPRRCCHHADRRCGSPNGDPGDA